jgi:iron(III) transport system substrate-binding protein
MKFFKNPLFVFFIWLIIGSCSPKKETLWVYTSTYKEVLSLYEPILQKEFPDLDIRWYQAGSETVAAKLNTEKLSGTVLADLLMTSDLFYFNELAREGWLHPFTLPENYSIPAAHLGPSHVFNVSRFPVMVIAYNSNYISPSKAPTSWSDLLKAEFKSKITMPSPLESGSFLTALFFLRETLGNKYLEQFRTQNVLSSGGNGSTMSRVLSGEKPIGIVLLENILQAREKGQKHVQFVIPKEGAFPIPSPVGIIKKTKISPNADKVAKWFFSPQAQELLVKGWVYSSNPEMPPPFEAPAWNNLKLAPWDFNKFHTWSLERQKLKDDFSSAILK